MAPQSQGRRRARRSHPHSTAPKVTPSLHALSWSPGNLSAQDLRLLTGLTDRRHRQIAEQGYFRPPIRGIYGGDCIAGIIKYLREQLHKRSEELAREQLELTRAKRETAQEELRVMREELLPKSEVGPALRNLALRQRAMLQFKLEQELAPKLAGRSTAEILAELRQAVDQICLAFKEGTRPWMAPEP